MSLEDDLVDVLAVARITRLVIDDRVPFGPFREWLKRDAWREQTKTDAAKGIISDQEPYVVELLSCPWCASVWVAIAVLFLRRLPGWRYLARVLAASQIAGMAATWVER